MVRRALLPAVAVIAVLAAGGSLPAQAGPEPDAVAQPTTCDDGYGVAHVQLIAADGADGTFTSQVRNWVTGAVVRDEDHLVPAGQTANVDLPGLLKGRYDLDVRVDGHQVLGASVTVTCTPTHPYKQPSWTGFSGCDRTSTYSLRNTPIKGSEDLLEKVHFVVHRESGKTYFDGDLPDSDANPYEESVVVAWDDSKGNPDDQVLVTADGEPLDAQGFAVATCVPTDPPDVPNTGF